MKKTILRPVVLKNVAVILPLEGLKRRLKLILSVLTEDKLVLTTKKMTYGSGIVKSFAGIIDKRRKRA